VAFSWEPPVFFRQLQTFQQAAKYGNFSDAARKLHLTQSAVSHQIKALEQVMGVKLYERHRRGIVLTEQGKEVLSHVNRIMARVRDLEECLNALRGGFVGNIAVAAHRGIIRYKLPQVVKLFRRSYPPMGIQLINKFVDDEIVSLVMSGSADFGVVTSFSDHGDLTYKEFLTYDIFLCVQPEHPYARLKPDDLKLTIDEVAAEPLLLYEPGTAIRRRVEKTFEQEGLDCNPVVETGGASVLRDYAQAGLGAAIISGLSLEATGDSGLGTVNVSHLFGKLGYGFVFRKDKFFTTALLDFINLLDPHFTLDDPVAS
jgi:DNA-binding transcriptional LysR family regulator